jgi:hypothetical protein
MIKATKVKYEVTISFGSKYQQRIWEVIFTSFLDALSKMMGYKHKNNLLEWVIEEKE